MCMWLVLNCMVEFGWANESFRRSRLLNSNDRSFGRSYVATLITPLAQKSKQTKQEKELQDVA